MSSTLVKVWVVVAAIVVALFAWGQWKDREASAANAIAVERVRVADSVTAAFQPVIAALRDSVEVQIVRVGGLIRRDTVTRFDTVFAVDTVTGEPIPAVPLAQHQQLVVTHDSLKAGCSLLVVTCQALSDSVPKLETLYRNAARMRDSVIAHPKPFRRWGISVTFGTGGCANVGGAPVCGVTGPSFRIW